MLWPREWKGLDQGVMLIRELNEESVCYCNRWKASIWVMTVIVEPYDLKLTYCSSGATLMSAFVLSGASPFLSPCKMRQHFFLSQSLGALWKYRPIFPQKATASSQVSGGWVWQPPHHPGKDHELEQLAVSPGKWEYTCGSTCSRNNMCTLVTALNHSKYRRAGWEFPKGSKHS